MSLDFLVQIRNNFWQRISWLSQRWRTQRNAIRNVNCRIQWIIESLNAYCALWYSEEHACLSIYKLSIPSGDWKWVLSVRLTWNVVLRGYLPYLWRKCNWMSDTQHFLSTWELLKNHTFGCFQQTTNRAFALNLGLKSGRKTRWT